MTKEEFQALLRKYRLGECSEEELEIINSFDSKLLEAPVAELSPDEQRRLERGYCEALDAARKARPARPLISWRSLGIAASVLLICAVGLYMFADRHHEVTFGENAIEEVKEVRNEGPSLLTVVLPDSSRVTLHKGAVIKYESRFDDSRRDVLLSGVASFDVRRDEDRPFSVYTGDVITKVLGTVFTVDATAPNDSVTVRVESGRVAVYQRTGYRPSDQETVLLPNQKAVFVAEKKTLSKTLVQDPRPLIPEQEVAKITFDNAPVSEVFRAIEKVYGIEIEFDETAFDGCYIKTSISGGEMFKRLGIICDAIGATYKVEGTRVSIVGSGCF